jgi:hypothetical protein
MAKRLIQLTVVFIAAFILLSVFLPSYVWAEPPPRPLAATCTVNNPADDGPGTLRVCLQSAAAGDTINFNPANFPLGSPVSIAPLSPLPRITVDNLTIDASNAGVILDGSGLGDGNGLEIDGASGVVIKGLQIINFPESGIYFNENATNNTIGGENATPGGGCSGDCNLISGNGENGISISRDNAAFNTISGNYIGTNQAGTAALPNNDGGVLVCCGAGGNNIIGGDTISEANLISGNNGFGVSLELSENNSVQGNIIGLSSSGGDLGNNGIGVRLRFSADNNEVKENTIAYTRYVDDDGLGCGIYAPSIGQSSYSRNSIYSNDDKGICAGSRPNRPVIITATTTAVTGTTLSEGRVEIYSDDEDEGRYYHGTVTATVGGVFTYSQAQPFTGANVTVLVINANGSTSEFAIRLSGSGVLENNGQAGAELEQTKGGQPTEENTQACTLGDVDTDGDLDAVCANNSPNYIYLNDGSGTFTPYDGFNSGNDRSSQAIQLDDLNGDTFPDVVVANAAGQNDQIYLNNGSGFFTLSGGQEFDDATDTSQALALNDLDGQNGTDIVVGKDNGKEIWLNDGSGAFLLSNRLVLTSVLTDTQGIASGDLNLDGENDLVVVHGSNQATEFWLNDGGGSLSFSLNRSEGSDDSRAVAIGYLDDLPGQANAYPDVFVANGSGQPSMIYYNVGGGTFYSRTLIIDGSEPVTNSNGVAIGRFDADDYADVIIASDSDQPNYVLTNKGDGTFNRNVIPTGTEADSQGVAVGDIDNDGDLDVFVANGNDNDGDEAAENEYNQVLKNLNDLRNRVGVLGGTLDFTQGQITKLVVPAGALTETVEFEYSSLGTQDDSVSELDGFSFAGRAFTLVRNDGKSAFNDSKSAVITLQYEESQFFPRLYYFDEGDPGAWRDIDEDEDCDANYSWNNGQMQATLCHLTRFGLFAPDALGNYLPMILKNTGG